MKSRARSGDYRALDFVSPIVPIGTGFKTNSVGYILRKDEIATFTPTTGDDG